MPEVLPTPSVAPAVETQADSLEPRILQTRNRVGDVIEVTPSGHDSDLENGMRILQAISTLDRLLGKKSLSKTELSNLQPLMKRMEHHETALEAFGADGIRRYFSHLSGPDASLPYTFPMPIDDEDLEAYLLYDFCHDDPAYQDQVAMDYLDEPIDSVAVNILISRLKANPDFLIRLLDNPRIHDGSDTPYLHRFTDTVKSDDRFKKASTALSYFFYFSKRNKLVLQYSEHREKGRNLKVGETRRKIRKLDQRFLTGLSKL